MIPHRTKFLVFPDILTPEGFANFMVDGIITIGLGRLWSNRNEILQKLQISYFKVIHLQKTFEYHWRVERIRENRPYDYKTSKALVDSIIAQSRYDKEGAWEGFKMFAPIFKQIYPEWWVRQFGERKIPYCKFEDGKIWYL